MAKEIEHKYLTVSGSYRDMQSSETRICQGYLSREPERTVRVRVADDRGFLIPVKNLNTRFLIRMPKPCWGCAFLL